MHAHALGGAESGSFDSPAERLNLIGLTPDALAEFFEGIAEKPYRARQVMRWIYRRGVLDFHEMTDLGLRLRSQLGQVASLDIPRATRLDESTDGTRKWLVKVGGGQAVETVYIPEPNRATLCISSQAGCAMGLPVLRNGTTRLQSKSQGRRNSGPGAACQSRPGIALGDHQRGIHGYGRTARQLS